MAALPNCCWSTLVSAVPGEPFFAPGCLRFSYAINEERLAEAGRRIKAFVQELV